MNASHYRGEAERCRKLAAGNPESDSATRWRQLAAEYDQLAQALDTDRNAPVRKQEIQQQQQAKAKPEGH